VTNNAERDRVNSGLYDPIFTMAAGGTVVATGRTATDRSGGTRWAGLADQRRACFGVIPFVGPRPSGMVIFDPSLIRSAPAPSRRRHGT
jgi:hypothetical protein